MLSRAGEHNAVSANAGRNKPALGWARFPGTCIAMCTATKKLYLKRSIRNCGSEPSMYIFAHTHKTPHLATNLLFKLF
jgi:hypothetical protein